ncbi:MAG: thioesterase [Faecalibacterium sp.]
MEKSKCYTESFQMKYGEGDFLGRVRPAVLMRYVEHVALKHATLLGVTREFNESYHMVFLLAKQAIEFRRMPRADEVLTFVTQPEHSKRLKFRRVTLIYDAAGEEVACVDSIWVLMDIDTHKLLRRSPVPFDEQWDVQIDRLVDMRVPKVSLLAACGEFNAMYTNCDANGHMNNANYFDVVCDVLPTNEMRQRELKRIMVNYHRELLLGECMQVKIGQGENGAYIVGNKGQDENKSPVFEAFCVY